MEQKRDKDPLAYAARLNRSISDRRRVTVVSIVCAAVLLCLVRTVFARDFSAFGPITTRNQNPVYLQTLSLTPVRAEVLPEGVIETRIDSAYSNLFSREQDAGALVDLDMEYWRLGVHTIYGLTDDLEVGVEIPLVHFNGGFLDGFVQKFHKVFGLPNGGREQVSNDRFSYRFAANGADRMNFSQSVLGLGDISLSVKNQLTGEDDDWPAIAWFADLKFPTGKRSRGFGNGTVDFGFGGAIDMSYERMHGYCNVGYYVTGGNDLLDGYMHGQMFAYMLAGELTILPTWTFIVQLDGSTPLLSGAGFDAWDGVPLDLVVGFKGTEFNIFSGGDFIWQVGFSEDVTSIGPSVDFTVFASVGVRFDIFDRSRPVGDWLAKSK